jgi:hypothetical protein
MESRELPYLSRAATIVAASQGLTIGSNDHGAYLRWAKEGVDDWDKLPSF